MWVAFTQLSVPLQYPISLLHGNVVCEPVFMSKCVGIGRHSGGVGADILEVSCGCHGGLAAPLALGFCIHHYYVSPVFLMHSLFMASVSQVFSIQMLLHLVLWALC
jgi:hypothetical protein